MRSEKEIKKIVLGIAANDERIRAVVLNGSRANPVVKPDKYQDYDLVFMVNNFQSFINDHYWTDIFGKKLIWQMPDEMTFGNKKQERNNVFDFSYLMIFEDGVRIDLTIFSIDYFNTDFKIDSLTILWLDKDNLFLNISPPSDKDYHIQKPSEKEFLDTCNEFWWVSTYVAKGLLRNEITYAKDMLETVVRPMFMKMIEWKIGIENDFSVSFGKSGKFMNAYLPVDFYQMILRTYSNHDIEENWKVLFLMTDLFRQTSKFLADKLGFNINEAEQRNTIMFLRKQYDERNVRE